jgi:tetratricopeptide (TPR) repeat protein
MLRRREVQRGAALAATLVFWSVLHGDPVNVRKDERPSSPQPTDLGQFSQEKLRQEGLLTYETQDKEILFALKLRVRLNHTVNQPRDFVVLFDTTASQAGESWLVQLALLKELCRQISDQDRIRVITVNTQPGELTAGFVRKGDPALEKALQQLSDITPMGAADLKAALDKAIESLDIQPGRQPVVVYIGDGMSSLRPIGGQERLRYAETFNRLQVPFYAIPIGFRLDPEFLHGMTGSTGGAVWRVDIRYSVPELWKQFLPQLEVPVLYPTEYQLPAEVAEAYPTKLPPLRADTSTLIVGRLRQLPQKFAWQVKGTVQEQPVQVSGEEKVVPPDVSMFFLKALVEQGRKDREAPALLPADRMLVMAHNQVRMVREELLAQGRLAIRMDRLDLARQLFEQAQQLVPHDPEARAAVRLVERLQQAPDAAQRRELLERGLAQAGPAGGGGAAAAQPNAKPDPQAEDLLRRQEQIIRILEQQLKNDIDEALRQLDRPLTAAEANEWLARLKLLTETVQRETQIGPQVREQLLQRLAAAMRQLERRLDEQRRREAEAQAREMQAQELARRQEQVLDEQARVRQLMQQFHALVQANRLMEAYRKGLQIAQATPGESIGVATSSQALASRYLGESQRLVQERQAKYLAAMLEIERSHVPFPDEPPITFAPASFYETKIFRNWNELSRHRIKRWLVSYLGEAPSERAQEIERMLSQPSPLLDRDFPADTPLNLVLETIEKKLNLPIRIDFEAFGEEAAKFDPQQMTLKKAVRVRNMSLGMILHDALASVEPQATYIIRRDTIEITSPQKAIAEKVLRVYPVPELVLPPLFGGNPFQLSTMIFGFGFQMGVPMMMWGMMMGMPGMMMGMPGMMMGMPGMMMGMPGMMMGMPGMMMGMPGMMMGMPGMMMGMPGMMMGFPGMMMMGGMMMGMMMGMPGMMMMGGFPGMMMMGGFPGMMMMGGMMMGMMMGFPGMMMMGGMMMGGMMLGGLMAMGGPNLFASNSSFMLIELIKQVVGGPGDWYIDPMNMMMLTMMGQQPPQDYNPLLANYIGYYDPAYALVVRATARLHERETRTLTLPAAAGGGAAGGMGQAGHGERHFAHADIVRDVEGVIGGLVGAQALRGRGKVVAAQLDAKKAWQEALARSDKPVDADVLFAGAAALAASGHWNHAAELLKAGLRQGGVARDWMFEAIALAIRIQHGDPEEEVRCLLSAADLRPSDAFGLLQGAEVLARHGKYAPAISLTRLAAEQNPELPHPYLFALQLASKAKDVPTVRWAAMELLRRDWPIQCAELHATAQRTLEDLAEALRKEGRAQDAETLALPAAQIQRRDLVIRLLWTGNADLDLEISEPSGSTCSLTQRVTANGGSLQADFDAEHQTEIYSVAEGYSGEYRVTVKPRWGKPVAGKAVVEIITHQGTPNEQIRREMITVAREPVTLTVQLRDGRRQQPAPVAPLEAYRLGIDPFYRPTWPVSGAEMLRQLAVPITTGIEIRRSPFGPTSMADPLPRPGDDDNSGPQLGPGGAPGVVVIPAGALVNTQALVHSDRRYVRLSANVTFSGITGFVPVPLASLSPGIRP